MPTTKSPYTGMPRAVVVGPYRYRMTAVKRVDDDDSLGVCVFEHQAIRVRTGQTAQFLADTVLHEWLHAIHHAAGLGDDDDEEAYTTRTATGLLAFIRNNSRAWSWYLRLVKSGASTTPAPAEGSGKATKRARRSRA